MSTNMAVVRPQAQPHKCGHTRRSPGRPLAAGPPVSPESTARLWRIRGPKQRPAHRELSRPLPWAGLVSRGSGETCQVTAGGWWNDSPRSGAGIELGTGACAPAVPASSCSGSVFRGAWRSWDDAFPSGSRAIDDEGLRNVIRAKGSSDDCRPDDCAVAQGLRECVGPSAEQSENVLDSTASAEPERTTTNRLRQYRHSSR